MSVRGHAMLFQIRDAGDRLVGDPGRGVVGYLLV